MNTVRKHTRFARIWLVMSIGAACALAGNFFFNRHTSPVASVLGYEPQLFYAGQENDPKTVTLFLHGWTDSYKQVNHFQKCGALTDCAASFNFYDASGHKYLHAAFGQLPDALAASWALNNIYKEKNPESINLYGYSRGGATAINTLAVLNNYDDHKQSLETLGISKADAQEIVNRIERGTVVLDCPLIHLPTTLKKRMPFFPLWFSEWVLSLISRYKPYGMHPLHTVKELDGLNITTLVHYQHNDRVVFNDHDASFYKALYDLNPDKTYVVLGHCGGHMHDFSCLQKPISKLYAVREQGAQPHIEDQKKSGLMRVGDNIHEIVEQFKYNCENH